MNSFRSVAALALLSSGYGSGTVGPTPHYLLPKRDHTCSDEPMSKRQKRRQRGKART